MEELRSDVLTRRCRVNPAEVETMALALSNVSRALADMKGECTDLRHTILEGLTLSHT